MEAGAAIVVAEGVAIEDRTEEVAVEAPMKVAGDAAEVTPHTITIRDTLAAVRVVTIQAATGWRTPIKKHIDLKVLLVIPTVTMVVAQGLQIGRG